VRKILIGTLITVTIILLCFGIFELTERQREFIKDCKAAGGSAYIHAKFWMCVSSDGRVIEIYGTNHTLMALSK